MYTPTAKGIYLVNFSFRLFEAEILLLEFRHLICNYGAAETLLTQFIVVNILLSSGHYFILGSLFATVLFGTQTLLSQAILRTL